MFEIMCVGQWRKQMKHTICVVMALSALSLFCNPQTAQADSKLTLGKDLKSRSGFGKKVHAHVSASEGTRYKLRTSCRARYIKISKKNGSVAEYKGKPRTRVARGTIGPKGLWVANWRTNFWWGRDASHAFCVGKLWVNGRLQHTLKYEHVNVALTRKALVALRRYAQRLRSRIRRFQQRQGAAGRRSN